MIRPQRVDQFAVGQQLHGDLPAGQLRQLVLVHTDHLSQPLSFGFQRGVTVGITHRHTVVDQNEYRGMQHPDETNDDGRLEQQHDHQHEHRHP